MDSRMIVAGFVAAIPLASPAAGQTVTDGDTIKLDGTIWRLWGIGAPETRQVGWPAGVAAMRRLTEGKTVVCELPGRDRYRRSIGLCRADGQDLGAAMVELGMAWAFTRYSSDYVDQERAAIGAKVGVHAHDCEEAWNWRAQRR